LQTGRWGLWQRYRGQTERGSWTARVIARLGESVVLALALLCCVGTAGAAASAPTPQKAPASGQSSQPSPDPAPQAEVKPHVSTPTAPAVRRPVVVSSAPADTTPATTPRLVTSSVRPVAPSTGGRAPTTSRLATTQRAAASHRPPATHRPRSQITSLTFPLTLPRDLLLLPRAGADSRGDGVLLLLSAAAMGVLTLASLSLLRRLRRIELR
jgi:hypothetical protein